MAKKKTPVNAIDLAEEAFTGAEEAASFDGRIARYGMAKTHAIGMRDHLQGDPGEDARQAGARLASCGNWLHFREYHTVDKVRLHAAQFCKQHLICPLCAIRRGAKSLSAYLGRWQVVQEQRPELRPYLITFTVKNGPDLAERHAHLTRALKRLMARRRDFNAGTKWAPWTELCKVEGGVYTHEVTNRGNGWHPHVHMLAACKDAPDAAALSAEWHAITGDSFVLDVRPITGDPVEGFMEVFKYAVKFSDLSYADNWHAAQVFKGKRMLASFGCFWGVKVPEELTDEPLDGLPYIDRFYRYIQGSYQLTGEIPREDVPEVLPMPPSFNLTEEDMAVIERWRLQNAPKPVKGEEGQAEPTPSGSLQSEKEAMPAGQHHQEKPMPKLKPIITGQEAGEVLKISDLIEVAGSRPDLARWQVSGVEYDYPKGALHVIVRQGLTMRRLELDARTKTAAKRAIFQDVRNS